jgi:hypothetical protein
VFRLPLILALALAGCAVHRPWTVTGINDPEFIAGSLAIVEAAKEVCADKAGYLAYGGQIVVHEPPNWINCNVKVPPIETSGCSFPGLIDILVYPPYLGPHPAQTALPHELCHLGLEPGPNYWGTVISASEAETDACAAKVLAAASRRFFR